MNGGTAQPTFDATPLQRDIDTLQEKIRFEIADNQIYRFAALLKGHDDTSHVTREEARNVAEWFYGVIAVLAAFAGPLLALASEAKKRRPSQIAAWLRTAMGLRLVAAARRMMLRIRKRVRVVRTKQVEKVVFKDREVVKEVQVPVDRIVLRD